MNTFWDRVAHLYDAAPSGLRWADKQAAIAEGVSGRVLEACCSTGALTLALRQRGAEACTLDLAPRMPAQAAARFAQEGLSPERLVQGDLTRLPFPDQAFDYVLVTVMLGLLPRPLMEAAFGAERGLGQDFPKTGRRAAPRPVSIPIGQRCDFSAMAAVMSAADASASYAGGDGGGGASAAVRAAQASCTQFTSIKPVRGNPVTSPASSKRLELTVPIVNKKISVVFVA